MVKCSNPVGVARSVSRAMQHIVVEHIHKSVVACRRTELCFKLCAVQEPAGDCGQRLAAAQRCCPRGKTVMVWRAVQRCSVQTESLTVGHRAGMRVNGGVGVGGVGVNGCGHGSVGVG